MEFNASKDGWGRCWDPGASSWPPPARLAPPGIQGPSCSTDKPSPPAGPSSLTPCVLRAKPRLPGPPRPARAPDPARSCPPRGPTCAAEARAVGFSPRAGPGRPFPQPPAGCPPCSASSGPFSALPGPLGTPLSLYLPAAHPLPASMSSRSWGRCPGRDVWPALSISGGLPSESNGEEGRMEGFLKEVAVTDPALHAGLQALR